jgi:hypothetical protein
MLNELKQMISVKIVDGNLDTTIEENRGETLLWTPLPLVIVLVYFFT